MYLSNHLSPKIISGSNYGYSTTHFKSIIHNYSYTISYIYEIVLLRFQTSVQHQSCHQFRELNLKREELGQTSNEIFPELLTENKFSNI